MSVYAQFFRDAFCRRAAKRAFAHVSLGHARDWDCKGRQRLSVLVPPSFHLLGAAQGLPAAAESTRS